MQETSRAVPFVLKDCALASIATGLWAQNLRELRDLLLNVDSSVIYNHFVGGLLRPRFDDPEYNNDFASWAAHALNDKRLAERLGIIDPAHFGTVEDLRREVIDVIDERLDESEHVPWSKSDHRFNFVRAQLVVFDTGKRFDTPEDLGEAIPQASLGSIFTHFIDARWRLPDGADDVATWLTNFDARYDALRGQLAGLDPYFMTLNELRRLLALVFEESLGSRRP